MNKKAIQMAVSTIVLMVLGILLLIAIILATTGGFDRFKSTTGSHLDSSQAVSVRQACLLACGGESKISYCCTEHEVNGENIKCNDPRLEVLCEEFTCEEDFCASKAG